MILSINKYYGSHLALLLIDNHSTVKGLGQNNMYKIRLWCKIVTCTHYMGMSQHNFNVGSCGLQLGGGAKFGRVGL